MKMNLSEKKVSVYWVIFLFLLVTLFNGCKKTNPPIAIPILPSITSISPIMGPVGTSVIISGAHFSSTIADNTVKFNGVLATITSATNVQLTVIAPAAGTTGPVSVSTTAGTATGPSFTYTVLATPPTINTISPISGPAGTLVTINGTNFKTTPTDNTVKFNGIMASVQTATPSVLTVLAPATGTTGAVTVSTADGTATGPVFTFLAKQPDVYLVGRAIQGQAYWKNNVITLMPSDCFVAKGIFVDGTDVYIAGTDASYAPKYWKNGVGVSLPMTAGNNNGQATSIFVSGTDVYVAGWDNNNGAFSSPRCWKNGVPLPVALSTGNVSGGLPVALGTAYAVFVSGSDVYLAGSQSPASGNQVATYWKNGSPVVLTDGSSVAEATGITVVGSDVFLSGYVSGVGQRVYWKNSIAVPISTPNNSTTCVGRGVYVSGGGDVYISGEYQNLAKVWKNGVMTDLTSTTPGPSTFESAFAITGNGADIYIAGTDIGKGTGYWKNGSFTAISGAQFVYGIVVK